MKMIGSWYVPDEENWPDVIHRIQNNNFSCYPAINKCVEYLQKFDLAIDIGTWIGDSTDQISRFFKNVVGFEANPEVFDCAKENLKTRSNVEMYNYALSDLDHNNRDLFVGVSSFSGWVNTLEDEKVIEKNKPKKVCSIESRTLDSFNFSQVDFLKIDADSHEGFILQGAINFFKHNNPLILIEYKPKVLVRQSKDMIDPMTFLDSIGYSVIDKPSNIDFICKR